MTRLYRLMLATAAVFGVPSAALADGPGSGEVTGVSVQASPGRADIVINVRGAVEVRDFMLQGPNRLVLDVMGARLKGKSAVRTKPARAPEVQLPASRLTRVASEEPRITVVWDRANVADVVAGFAAFSGRTIILGKGITGEVTAEIRNQPWPQAFQAILASQGLSAQEMAGGIIRVDNPSALNSLDSLEPLETAVIRINYAKAKELTKSIEGSLTKGRGKVIADENTNSLIITDTRSKV